MGTTAVDKEFPKILALIKKASEEAARTHGLKSLADVERSGHLGTVVHATLQELLGPGGKYFHPRIATEVQVDIYGKLIETGPRGLSHQDSLIKDTVILKPGQDVRNLRAGRQMKYVTDWVLDLKTGITGARSKSTETLIRFGIRPLTYKPFDSTLDSFTQGAKGSVKGLTSRTRVVRFLKRTGKKIPWLKKIPGISIGFAMLNYSDEAEASGHGQALLQSAYDVIPYSAATDAFNWVVEEGVAQEPCHQKILNAGYSSEFAKSFCNEPVW